MDIIHFTEQRNLLGSKELLFQLPQSLGRRRDAVNACLLAQSWAQRRSTDFIPPFLSPPESPSEQHNPHHKKGIFGFTLCFPSTTTHVKPMSFTAHFLLTSCSPRCSISLTQCTMIEGIIGGVEGTKSIKVP